MEIALNQDLSTEEILQKFPEEKRRTVQRHIKNLKENNQILRVRIRGKGKRLRWIIPEEKGNDIWIRAFRDLDIKKKKFNPVNIKLTQRRLSQAITEEKKFYLKRLKIAKKEPYDLFVFYHLAVASGCMEWILQLTWAINSGVFSESENKLNLAYRNRERYEDFLSRVIYNLRERDEEKFKSISATVYNLLAHSSLMINVFYPNEDWQPNEPAIPKAMSLH